MKTAEEWWDKNYEVMEKEIERITVDGRDFLLEAEVDDWPRLYTYWDHLLEDIHIEMINEVEKRMSAEAQELGSFTDLDIINFFIESRLQMREGKGPS